MKPITLNGGFLIITSFPSFVTFSCFSAGFHRAYLIQRIHLECRGQRWTMERIKEFGNLEKCGGLSCRAFLKRKVGSRFIRFFRVVCNSVRPAGKLRGCWSKGETENSGGTESQGCTVGGLLHSHLLIHRKEKGWATGRKRRRQVGSEGHLHFRLFLWITKNLHPKPSGLTYTVYIYFLLTDAKNN